MKNHRFLWLRNRTTNNRKCEKARNIKEKRTIEMFSTVSKQLVEHLSSQRDNYKEYQKNIKTLGNPVFSRAFFMSVFWRKKIYKYRKPLIPVLAGSNGL